MSTPEAKASATVKLLAGKYRCRLFRNNSGMFRNDRGQPVYFGLGNSAKKVNGKKVSDIRKSSDEIGYTKVIVTPEMVGHEIAVFTSIEIKKDGFVIRDSYPAKSRESKQLVWCNMVKKAGGIAGFAYDNSTLKNIIDEFYSRFTK